MGRENLSGVLAEFLEFVCWAQKKTVLIFKLRLQRWLPRLKQLESLVCHVLWSPLAMAWSTSCKNRAALSFRAA